MVRDASVKCAISVLLEPPTSYGGSYDGCNDNPKDDTDKQAVSYRYEI